MCSPEGRPLREDAGPVAGGAAGWELTPWLGVDGNLSWLKTFGDAEAFTAAVNARAHFLTNRAVLPYVRAGFGLYRTSFNSTLTDVPDFYRRRIADASSGYDSSYRFTDPAWVFGGGLTIFRSRHVAIHPAAEAIVVRRDAQSYVVTSVTVHISYHFELHPSPAARSEPHWLVASLLAAGVNRALQPQRAFAVGNDRRLAMPAFREARTAYQSREERTFRQARILQNAYRHPRPWRRPYGRDRGTDAPHTSAKGGRR